MSTDRSQDAPERQRLEALVDRLSDADLRRDLGDGWTVSAVLAHLAFWDRRAAILVERWRRDGVSISHIDVDVVNDSAKTDWLALPPRVAARQAVEAARAADAALDAAPELVEQIVAVGYPINVRRSVHRKEHLDPIERALAG
jgi:Mycothiol maleylpyruvate isomerase N-terminal domain